MNFVWVLVDQPQYEPGKIIGAYTDEVSARVQERLAQDAINKRGSPDCSAELWKMPLNAPPEI